MPACACGSGAEFALCCEPFLTGAAIPDTAEKAMRARYTAYTRVDVPYLMASLHPSKKEAADEESARRWASSSEWLGLQVVATQGGGPRDTEGVVQFTARFRDRKGDAHTHHEVASFVKEDGRWLFMEGQAPEPVQQVRTTPKIGRNDPCPCGSGKKFKKCCEKAA
jgi:SEC-C motif-containing protein